MFKTLVVFSIFISSIFSDHQKNSEQRFVVVVYRHGDRAPTKTYPRDPYKDITHYWPDGPGELTNTGIQHQYELGKWLRNRYTNFLPENFSVSDIYVRSSDRDRTLMSAAANLAGLYPPKETQIWNQKLLWRPVPIHTVPNEEDAVVAMKKECPKYNLLYDELLNSSIFRLVNQRNRRLYDFLSNNTGWNVTEISQIESIYSILSVEEDYNLTLSAWTRDVFPEKLDFLAALYHASFSFTKLLARLKNGPFFDYIFSYFDSVINNSTALKLLMISGHDNTISSILSAMGVYDYTYPRFTATVIWELKQVKEQFYINLFYKNNATVLKLKLFGCEMNCEYEAFKKILEPVIVNEKEWIKECVI